jgi:FkbM family methyltransferase
MPSTGTAVLTPKYAIAVWDQAVQKDIVSAHITKTGTWQLQMVNALLPFMDKDTTFVDIGANIGAYSLEMASRGFKVVAYEPFPRNRAMFSASQCLEPELFANVTLIPNGLSDKQETCTLWSPYNNYGDIHVNCDGRTSWQGYTHNGQIEMARLDDVATQALINTKKVLKIDVEGFEARVVAGARKFLTTGSPPRAIFAEVQFLEASGVYERFKRMLAASGYTCVTPMGDDALFYSPISGTCK